MTSKLDRDRERFHANPGDSRTFEALEERLFLAGDWLGLVDLYRQRLKAPELTGQPEARAKLLFRLGQIFEERCQEPDRGIECYRQALAVHARFRPALQQLRRLHSRSGQWDLALQIAEMESALPMSDAERASLLSETGLLWLERLDDAEQARELFSRALEADPHHAGALRGWARALQACGKTELAASAWQRLAEQLRGPERAAALVALAELLGGPFDRSGRTGELYRRALGDDPRNPEAIEAMAIQATMKEQWPLLADLMERRFEAAVDPARRVEIALEAAEVERDRLSNGAAARVWYARAAELGPENPVIFEALAELERERGDERALLQQLERVASLRGGQTPVSTWMELASLHSAAGDDERARVHLQSALGRAPEDALVMEALSDTLMRLRRYPELVATLERRAGLSGTDARTTGAVYAELGSLHEKRLGDVDAARAAYERAFAALPASVRVATALERIYRAQADWEALCSLLAQAARNGPAEQRSRLLCELGDLLAERLDRPEQAARAYETVLAADARALSAHRGLQQLAAASGDGGAVIRSLEREAEVTSDRMRLAHLVGALLPLLEQAGRLDGALEWALRWMQAAPEDADAYQECARLHEASGHDLELVAVLEKLDPLLDTSERAANRRRLAAHHGAHGRPEAAIRACEAALEADPGDAEALDGLVTQLENAGRFDDLARARRRLAELLPPAARSRCLDALATLLVERLDDPNGAIEVLRELAREQAPPPDLEPRLEALLSSTERWDDLVRNLDERQQGLPLDSAAGIELALRRAGLLLEKLKRTAAAEDVYREIRAADPNSAEARAGLERSLRSGGDAAAIAAFLAEEAEAAPTATARERAALERAALLEERLERLDEARESYGELALAAGDAEVATEAGRRLERLLERTGAWPALREHLETQPAEGEPEIARRARLAQLCRDQLADPDGAAQHLQAATALAPQRADLWRELAALHDAAGRHAELAEALEAEIAAGADGDRELALRARLGALCAGPLAAGERAREHYERLLELDPVHPAAAEFMIEHLERDGRVPTVVRLLEARLQMIETSSPDPEPEREAQRLSVRLRIAALSAGPLDDVDAAIATLEPLLGSVGPQPVVAEPLAQLYLRAGYAQDYLDLCRRASGACRDPGEQALWLLRLGKALREKGELKEACEVYACALDRRPEDREIQAALRDLYRRLGDSPALARLLEMELGHRSGVDELPLRLELSALLAELGRPADSLEHLRRVLHLEPGHAEALDRALALLEAAGGEQPNRAATLLQLVDAALERSPAPSRRAALLTRRARALAELPGRGEEAALSYREALALEPSPALRLEQRALLEAESNWDAVLDCLLEEATGAGSGARGALFEHATEIAQQHFSAEAALPWLQRLRTERPRDPSVPQRLAQIHRGAQSWESLLQALDDELAICTHPPRRRDLQVEKARLLEERFHSRARAAAALECARREVPRDRQVLHDLERLYRASGHDRERVSVLQALLQDGAADEKVALHCELAALYTDSLSEPVQASAQLLHAVAATPTGSAMRAQLLAALGETLRSACMPDAWARCAEHELRALDADAEVFRERRWELQNDLARVYENELGRPDAALRHLRRLVDDPLPSSDPGARAASDAAQRALLRLLRVERSWVELERRLAVRLERQPERADDWLDLARLRAERLYALPGAAEAYRRVLGLEPVCLEAIRGLRSAAERLRDWTEVAATLDRELQHPELVPGDRAALLRHLGDVCWRQLGSTTRASRSYAAALEANPLDFDSLHSLQQLLEAMEDWRGALDLYESEIEVLDEADRERHQEVWLRVGELAREHSGELERARRAYLRAADSRPLAAPRRRELAELHERCDDPEAFAEVFASWCDDAAAGASGADHLRLAETLEKLDRQTEALERVERALTLDEELAPAWDALARLHEARGETQEAAQALCAAAERVSDADAAQRQLRAAELIEPDDPEGAATLLRSAARRDPGAARVHALLARVGARLGRPEEVMKEARRALDLREALDVASRLELARIGGRAAGERGRSEDAARFFSQALALQPDDAEALAGYGVALAAEGDLEGARRALEMRVDQGDRYADRAGHLALIGRALAASGDALGAVERYEEALRDEPQLDDAHRNLVRLHEGANRIDAGVTALERWADAAREPNDRIEHLLRAAAWELREGGRAESAERHLREVLEASPRSANTWEALAGLLWEQERADEALEVATAGLEALDDAAPRARLALIRGRALERQGQRREASEAFSQASEADPSCAEASLANARLLRGLGEWRAAALALQSFDAHNAGAAPTELAEVLHQLARLSAGPLEDVDAALEGYRRTLLLAPERRDVRVALTELLSHRPGEWKSALAQLRLLLDDDPTDPATLHMLQRVAINHEADRAAAQTRGVLKALGIAPPSPGAEDAGDPSLSIAEPRQLEDRVGEALRRLASEAADEIAGALEATESTPVAASNDAAGGFRMAVLATEGRLTAPALLPLCDEELAEVLTLVAGICLEGDPLQGSGDRLNALSNALGRRTRRKLRRLLEGVLLGEIRALDFGAWRQDVRALAAAAAVDETDIDLRGALLALLGDGPAPPPDELPENADLTPFVAACPQARALTRLAVQACLRSL